MSKHCFQDSFACFLIIIHKYFALKVSFNYDSDCRCVVLWGDLICHVGGCISFWGSRGTYKFPKDDSGNILHLCLGQFSIIIQLLFLNCWILQRILKVQYSIPDYVQISPECRHLISRIFVADPEQVSL